MPPRCKRCKKGEALDKPLFGCVRCPRYYHSACHRPHPRDPISNWACKRCLAEQGGQGQAKRPTRFYHDSSLLSSRVASPASPNFAPSPTMAPSATTASPTASTTASTASPATAASLTSQRNGSTDRVIACSFPGCPAKIDGSRDILCRAHLQAISKTARSRDAAPVNGRHPAPLPLDSSNSAPQPPMLASNPKKLLLSETEKDPPILRRKTAGKAPPFIPQQPTPKHSTPPSRGESTMSPPSPHPVAPHSSVQSPPASPGALPDGEPSRKRQRVSPSPKHSPESKLNGTRASGPSTADADPGDKPTESGAPPTSRRPSNPSPQRLGKRETEVKPVFKTKFKHPVRRMPQQLSKLRFIESPRDRMPRVVPDQPKPGVNGSTGDVSWQSLGEAAFSLNEGIKDFWTGKMNNSTPSLGRIESTPDLLRPTLRIPIPELQNGHSQKPSLDKTRSDTQAAPRQPQTNGNTPSKPHPQTIHFPIRPAPTPALKPLPQKTIDTSHFDSLIYSQADATTPPPDLEIPPLAQQQNPNPLSAATEEKPLPEDEPLYAEIDPRIHWPQHHSPAWHEAKQEEIRARGKKKANFGRAANSLRRQQGADATVSFEDTLPEKILENPAWVRVLRQLRGVSGGGEDEGGGVNGNGSGGEGEKEKVGVQPAKRGRKPGKRVGSGSGSGSMGAGSVSGSAVGIGMGK